MNDSLTYGALSGASLAAGLALLLLAGSGAAGDTPVFWYFSRASGVVSYLLLWVGMVAGLLLSGRMAQRALSPAVVLDVHRTLTGWAIGFAIFHGLVLVGDRSVGLTLAGLLVPFGGSYEPAWIAAGQLSACMLAALLASSVWRRQLGNRTWRALHFMGFGAYWLSLGHALALGSDTGRPAMVFLYALTGGVVVWLTSARIFARRASG